MFFQHEGRILRPSEVIVPCYNPTVNVERMVIGGRISISRYKISNCSVVRFYIVQCVFDRWGFSMSCCDVDRYKFHILSHNMNFNLILNMPTYFTQFAGHWQDLPQTIQQPKPWLCLISAGEESLFVIVNTISYILNWLYKWYIYMYLYSFMKNIYAIYIYMYNKHTFKMNVYLCMNLYYILMRTVTHFLVFSVLCL